MCVKRRGDAFASTGLGKRGGVVNTKLSKARQGN